MDTHLTSLEIFCQLLHKHSTWSHLYTLTNIVNHSKTIWFHPSNPGTMTAHAKQKLEKNQEIHKPEDLLVVMAEGISHTPELCLCKAITVRNYQGKITINGR